MEDLRHVFINFNFENDVSQLAIGKPMVSSNLHAIHNVGKTSLPNFTKHSKSVFRIRGNRISSSSILIFFTILQSDESIAKSSRTI